MLNGGDEHGSFSFFFLVVVRALLGWAAARARREQTGPYPQSPQLLN